MQNSKLKKEILGQHKEVSAEKLENYLNGKLSASEARSVELSMNSSDFSSDAADGFKTYGGGVVISDTNKSWKSSNSNRMIWTSVSAVLVVFISLYAFQDILNPPVNAPDSSNLNESLLIVQEENTPTELIISEHSPTEEKEEPTNQKTGKKDKTLESTEAINSSTSQSLPLLFSSEIEKEIFIIKPLQSKTGNLHLDRENITLKKHSARLRHYRNYKLVDQGIGIDESLLRPILDGTPAFMERIVVNPKYPDWMPADSIYKVSVNEAIDWIIDADYNLAKMRFKRLLENTPNDLTSAFYLGYTLYLKDEYESAIYYLNKAQTHEIQTYDEDSRFIEIKCLLQLGKDADALKEALNLKNADSFYADRAMELVE